MSDITEAVYNKVLEGFTEESLVKVKKDIENVVYELRWRVEEMFREDENIAFSLQCYVVAEADRLVNAIIDGDENVLRKYISCTKGGFNGRSDGFGRDRTIEQQHPIIHRRLFEQGGILRRKNIVDAFPELLKSERIKDLEDQLASVIAQHNKVKEELDRVRNGY